jgi:hypothetical protein
MECDRWIEEGLLLCSGELEGERRREYEEHVARCETCSNEIGRYQEERRLYFTPGNLEYSTSQTLDERIQEACTKIPRPSTSINLFATVARKVAAAGLFLAVGIGGSLYFVYNIERADSHTLEVRRGAPSAGETAGTEQDALASSRTADGPAAVEPRDSADTDSGDAEPSATIVKRGGGTTGVVPVDLKDDR